MKSKKSVLSTVLIVWVIFTTLYLVYGEYNRFKVYIAQRSYQSGVTATVNKLMSEAQKCDPIPVTAGELSINLINIECLKNPNEEVTETPGEGVQ